MYKVWIKVYMEIIDDPKMATLPDRLWRRVIELFLLAGRVDQEGALPEINQIAWALRMDVNELSLDMQQIETTGIIQRTARGWLVVNFAKRQAAMSDAERKRQERDRRHKEGYYDVTPPSRNVTQNRIDKNRIEENRGDVVTSPPPSPSPQIQKTPTHTINLMQILSDAAGLSAIPPKESERIEQITCLVEAHGAEQVTAVLKEECSRWVGTKSQKTGKYYSKTNMGWVDWAQEKLDGGGSAPNGGLREITMAEWSKLPNDEAMAYLRAGRMPTK